MILVCGEALLDVFVGDETRAGVGLDGRVGGSPFNVAVGLARLGSPVAFLGAISTDALGGRLLRALQAEGVNTEAVRRVDAPTTLGLVGLDEGGVPSYAFHGERGADRRLGLEALAALRERPAAIHVGSYATVVEPVASTLRVLVEREQGRSLLSYDPNVRLAVEPDPSAWRGALDVLLPRVDLVKVSVEDLALLAPGSAPDAFARHALARGVRLVVVTRGGEGASAWTRRATAAVPAFAVPVVDTVGAGDAFQAALLAWLVESRHATRERLDILDVGHLSAALAFAARAAGVACSRRGADLPRRQDLDLARPAVAVAGGEKRQTG